MLISSSALKLTECGHNFGKTVCINNYVLRRGTEKLESDPHFNHGNHRST